MKVIAAVKFNDGVAFVLDEPIKYVYTKYKTCIIGTDGLFYDILCYAPSRGIKAFGGHKFTVTLNDGEEVHCSGDWWSGFNEESLRITGPNLKTVTIKDKESLDKCYVFSSSMVNIDKFKEFAYKYRGILYDYFDYEYICCSRRKRIKCVFGRQRKRKVIKVRKTIVYLSKYRNQMRKSRGIGKLLRIYKIIKKNG